MAERNDQPAARRPGARPLAALVRGAVEPALLRRAGLTMTLVANWSEIAGPDLAKRTRPLRVRWGRRPHAGAEAAPGTLVVAASGDAALRLQHEGDQIIERVNVMHGHRAIAKLAIVQAPPPETREPRARPELSVPDRERIERSVEPIEHDGLRDALSRLGTEMRRGKRDAD